MSTHSDDDLLLLSGIQHFAFCERQWALIQIENQWAENVRTVEGKHLHERVDDPYFTETRNDVKVVRSVPLMSRRLGFTGVADAIEYISDGRLGNPPEVRIVEYKRGRPKPDDRDAVQLCAQAMCIEEMHGITISFGFLFYGETRHGQRVDFSSELRERVVQLSDKMHELFDNHPLCH